MIFSPFQKQSRHWWHNLFIKLCAVQQLFHLQWRHLQTSPRLYLGSPVSPVVANLCMEETEETAIDSTPVPPKIWKRYVDNSFCVIKKNAVTSFHDSLTLSTSIFPSPSSTNLMASCHSSTPLLLAIMRGSTLMSLGAHAHRQISWFLFTSSQKAQNQHCSNTFT